MTTGPSVYLANELLDALANASAFSVATPYMKLHIGDPGAAGTSSPAVETTRKLVSFGAGAAGAVLNDVAITWTNVAASEDYTFFSFWDTVGPAGGNFLISGTITANPVTAADTFNIVIGALAMTMGTA